MLFFTIQYIRENEWFINDPVIVAVDTNHTDIKTILPKFHKNVEFLTREKNI